MAATEPVQGRVSKTVKVLLALKGMDQQQLAHRLGWDKSTMTRALRGDRRWQIEDLEMLGEVFDLDPTYFMQPIETLVRSRCFALVAA